MADRKAVVIETDKLESKPKYGIVGLPDVGLVGSISAGYLVSSLKAKEIAYVDSDALPPVMVLHESVPKETTRLFSSGDNVILLAEIPLPPSLVPEVIRTALLWLKSNGVKEIFGVGGVPAPDRAELEKPGVFVVSTSPEKRKKLVDLQMNLLEEGVITGPFAYLMRESIRAGIPCTMILGQAYQELPDPEASVEVLDSLKKVGGPSVDVSSLTKMASEIKIRSKELIQKGMQQEEDKGVNVPMMYG
ncbi:MAG: PAC2 family protein [Thermoprotei archaeon]